MAVVPHVCRLACGIGSLLITAWLSASAIPLPPVSAPRTTPPYTSRDSLARFADVLFYRGQYDSLIGIASDYARRAEAGGDSVLLGRALAQRGRALLMLGKPDAERNIDAGIRISEAMRDTFNLMPAVNFKGFIHWSAGRRDEAVACYNRRLLLAQKSHAPLDEAWARTSLGFAFHNMGDQKRARAEYMRALELFHAGGRRRLEITPLIGLGRVENALGNSRAAIRWNEQALVAARETGDRMNEMWASNNLSNLETARGNLSRSWEYTRHATKLARELKSPYAMVTPAINLFGAFDDLGDFERAEAVLNETRALCETQGAVDQLPTLDFRLGYLRLDQGRPLAACAILRKLVLHPESLEAQQRDLSVMFLARALAAADSLHTAIDLLDGYINTPGRQLYGAYRSNLHLALGRLYYAAGDPRAALRCARLAGDAARSTSQTASMASAMFLESGCCRDIGELAVAASTFHAALDTLEAVRGSMESTAWREVYGQWVSRDVVEAGRVLLEYPPASSRSEREHAFFDAMQRVKSRALLDRINRPRTESATVQTRLSGHVASLSQVQASLLPGECLLDFSVGDERSYLAAVTPDSLHLVELPGTRSTLPDRIQLFRSVVSTADVSLRSRYGAARLANMQRALGRDILEPVGGMLERSRRVLVCPDGFFAAVPFGLLVTRDGGAALLKERDVVQVPAASVLVLERSKRQEVRPVNRMVAINVSTGKLTGARAETKDLAHHYRHVERVADLAGIDAFTQAAKSADALHIASHALVVDRSPWWSGIQLRQAHAVKKPTKATGVSAAEESRGDFFSDVDSLAFERAFPSDPYVRAWQIAQLNIPAQLAVLSACETAGGRMTTGEGTLGLTAAFLSAGVPVVVSSLWPVDDRVTGIIMHSFYQNLAAGQSIAGALRMAQLETSRSARYAHPFYWSGFTVVGDGARVIHIEKRMWTPGYTLVGVALLVSLAALVLFVRQRRARAIY